MHAKTRICLDTLTVSSGCPTITLDAPVSKKAVVYVNYVATEDKFDNDDTFCLLDSFVGGSSCRTECPVYE